MLRFIVLSVLQSALLAAGQVCLKLAALRMGGFTWTWEWFAAQLHNGWLALTGLCLGGATVLWVHILRHFPFSVAYPLTSVAYVFGMLAAMLVFKEHIPASRWAGLFLLISGICLIIKP